MYAGWLSFGRHTHTSVIVEIWLDLVKVCEFLSTSQSLTCEARIGGLWQTTVHWTAGDCQGAIEMHPIFGSHGNNDVLKKNIRTPWWLQRKTYNEVIGPRLAGRAVGLGSGSNKVAWCNHHWRQSIVHDKRRWACIDSAETSRFLLNTFIDNYIYKYGIY